MTDSLTLYDIERGLLDLIEAREEEMLRGTTVGVALIEGTITEYLRAEIAKADGIAYYIKEFEAHEEILSREIEKLTVKRDTWRRRREDVKAMVAGVMQQSGKTKLQGATHTLTLRKNPPSVDVKQPELVPNEYRRVTVKCTAEQWRGIVAVLMSSQERSAGDVEASRRILASLDVSDPVPMKAEISAQLKSLVPMVERLAKARADHQEHSEYPDQFHCKECADIAWIESEVQLLGVPGCEMITDKVSLQVK